MKCIWLLLSWTHIICSRWVISCSKEWVKLVASVFCVDYWSYLFKWVQLCKFSFLYFMPKELYFFSFLRRNKILLILTKIVSLCTRSPLRRQAGSKITLQLLKQSQRTPYMLLLILVQSLLLLYALEFYYGIWIKFHLCYKSFIISNNQDWKESDTWKWKKSKHISFLKGWQKCVKNSCWYDILQNTCEKYELFKYWVLANSYSNAHGCSR